MISIHALREEGDVYQASDTSTLSKFLSTPSVRRATLAAHLLNLGRQNFYPRPPRGGRLASPVQPRRMVGNFYPRPPRGGRPLMIAPPKSQSGYFYPRPPRGGRRVAVVVAQAVDVFLSTPSARRATHHKDVASPPAEISIHALREEGDRGCLAFRCGRSRFLSTPSARRATRQKG